jgi:hypothetical protein
MNDTKEQADKPNPTENRPVIAVKQTSKARWGIVTLSEIGPIWTIDRQDKSLKPYALKSAAVSKFQSNRLNVTTPSGGRKAEFKYPLAS